MDNTKYQIILFCKSQKRSKEFYSEVLGQAPVLDVTGMTEFILTDEVKLGLMPEASIAKIINDKAPRPSSGNGIPRCELYIYTKNVGKAYLRAMKAGAKEISKPELRNWGDFAGYLSDPDGHIIAFAQKPIR